MDTKFWERWVKADELERHRILEELPIFKKGEPFAFGVTTTLLNSYFEDLLHYLKEART